jgi:hypothetical protein
MNFGVSAEARNATIWTQVHRCIGKILKILKIVNIGTDTSSRMFDFNLI